MKRYFLFSLAVVAGLSVTAHRHDVAGGTVDAPLAADTSRVVDLDEVIVVSQPKEQFRLRQQPLSSTVLTDGQLTSLHIEDLSQLSQFVPSFVVPSYGSRLTSSIYVRGIGSRVNSPAVGVYYDNVPLMSKSAFNTHFYMIDRIDVLRGPQATLYGQNAEGGLVRLYSRNPMNYQGTDVRLGVGTGLYSNAEVAHYHRPSEHFAFSAALFYSGLRGFIDNANFDQKNDLTNEAGGRMRFVWQPTHRLTFDLTTDYQYVNQNGFGYGLYQADDNLLDVLSNGAESHISSSTVADPATTIMNGYKRNMLNTGLTVSYQLPYLLLSSTTSHQYLNDRMVMDQDYLTPDYLRLMQRQRQNALTQELTLRSTNPSRWQHTSGLFVAHQWLRTDAPVFFGDAITGPIGSAIENAMKQAMLQAMVGRFMGQGMTPEQARLMAQQTVDQMGVTMTADMAVTENFHTPQLNLAAYHESHLQLADRLTATLGLRLDYDRVKIAYDALAYMAMTGGTANAVATYTLTSHVADHLSKAHTQLLPKLGLTWQLPRGRGNLYATVSKGYRAGGYNIQMFSDILQTDLNNPDYQQQAQRGDVDVPHADADYQAIADAISYKPEVSWNYEGGAHLNLSGGRLHADVALFYMQIRNQQLSQMSPLYNYGRIMVNAGRSHSCGMELTLRGIVLDGRLDWSVAYGFTNAEFDKYVKSDEVYTYTTVPGGELVTLPMPSVEGNYVPFVPRHTLAATADLHVAPRLTLGASASAQGKTWWDEYNLYYQQFYALLGAHADYDLGPVGLSLWGRNLTNTHYNTFLVSSSASGDSRSFAQRGTPLQVGLDVRIHF